MCKGRRLAETHPERRRRLGRGRRELCAGLCGLSSGAEHGVADGMGLAWPDGRRCGATDEAVALGVRLSRADRRRRTDFGRKSVSPRRVSRASFICAITAMRNIFPLWALARYRNLKTRQSRIRFWSGCSADARIIAVTGLKAEARIAAGPGVLAIAGGGDAARSRTRPAKRPLARKASAIISFGVAGGLAPGPRSGLDACRARDRHRGWRALSTADPAWSERLSAALEGAAIVDIAGVDAPLVDHGSKAGPAHQDRRPRGRHGIPYRRPDRRRP